MDRASAEQQARVWAWWTGDETRAKPISRRGVEMQGWHWGHHTGYGWSYGMDITRFNSDALRRAIEAKGWSLMLGTKGPPLRWWCEVLGPDNYEPNYRAEGSSLEAALYAAALAAASTDATADRGAGGNDAVV